MLNHCVSELLWMDGWGRLRHGGDGGSALVFPENRTLERAERGGGAVQHYEENSFTSQYLQTTFSAGQVRWTDGRTCNSVLVVANKRWRDEDAASPSNLPADWLTRTRGGCRNHRRTAERTGGSLLARGACSRHVTAPSPAGRSFWLLALSRRRHSDVFHSFLSDHIFSII